MRSIFPDLLDTTYRLLEENKKIYIAGLDGDFKQQNLFYDRTYSNGRQIYKIICNL